MKLEQYLKKYSLTVSDFAKKADIIQSQVWRYINKNQIPKPVNMSKIKKATDGLVTIRDLYPDT